jgi:hypothetical protein
VIPLRLQRPALAAVLLAGCDAGGDLLARGADAEAAGNYPEAIARYAEACAKSAKHCPLADRLRARLAVKAAWKAVRAGEYRKARLAIETGKAAASPAVKAAAELCSQDAELVSGLAWEEASALADEEQALPRMEALASQGVPLSEKARAWLAKNRPGLLLARVKGACKAGSGVSCAEAGRALAAGSPGSAEDAEARALVQADYQRVHPLLKQAEGLIVQRVELYDKDQLVALCVERNGGAEADACAAKVVGGRRMPTPSFLDGAWRKKLDEIGDPFFVKGLEARYGRAASAGEYDPEPWPKPEGAK